jgi:isoaspartyl peptidase/L-asparaginase-like protein (Ntn-hydrolase superfamily)
MKRRPTPDMAALFAEGTQMDRAVARAVKKAVEPHIRAGNRIAVMENGKVRLPAPAQARRRVKGRPRCAG